MWYEDRWITKTTKLYWFMKTINIFCLVFQVLEKNLLTICSKTSFNDHLTIRPKLKLSLFALYRPKISRRLKRFYWKKSIVFLLVTTVHRVTFCRISTETIAEVLRNLEINAISRQLLCLLVSLVWIKYKLTHVFGSFLVIYSSLKHFILFPFSVPLFFLI